MERSSEEELPLSNAVMAEFVAECVAANHGDRAQDAVREILARRVSDPRATLRAIGEPTRAGLTVFHRSPTLTIFAATWTPQMNLMPHDHRMWALIGIYTGREDNILWRPSGKRLAAYEAVALFEGGRGRAPGDGGPLGHEPARALHGRHPRVRRRLLRDAAPAVESGDAAPRSLRTAT
jgi:hypothetical protein